MNRPAPADSFWESTGAGNCCGDLPPPQVGQVEAAYGGVLLGSVPVSARTAHTVGNIPLKQHPGLFYRYPERRAVERLVPGLAWMRVLVDGSEQVETDPESHDLRIRRCVAHDGYGAGHGDGVEAAIAQSGPGANAPRRGLEADLTDEVGCDRQTATWVSKQVGVAEADASTKGGVGLLLHHDEPGGGRQRHLLLEEWDRDENLDGEGLTGLGGREDHWLVGVFGRHGDGLVLGASVRHAYGTEHQKHHLLRILHLLVSSGPAPAGPFVNCKKRSSSSPHHY